MADIAILLAGLAIAQPWLIRWRDTRRSRKLSRDLDVLREGMRRAMIGSSRAARKALDAGDYFC
jgi:hypothetical protein